MTTYREAKKAILAALPSHGWIVQTRNRANGSQLKVPHATMGGIRLYFKAQAIYVSPRPPHKLNTSHSLTESNKAYVGREADLTDAAFCRAR